MKLNCILYLFDLISMYSIYSYTITIFLFSQSDRYIFLLRELVKT